MAFEHQVVVRCSSKQTKDIQGGYRDMADRQRKCRKIQRHDRQTEDR